MSKNETRCKSDDERQIPERVIRKIQIVQDLNQIIINESERDSRQRVQDGGSQ